MVPAGQCLEAVDRSGVEVDDRLVLQRDGTLAHPLADQGMVLTQLAQLAATEQVGTAVADVHELGLCTGNADGGQRRAHAAQGLIPFAQSMATNNHVTYKLQMFGFGYGAPTLHSLRIIAKKEECY